MRSLLKFLSILAVSAKQLRIGWGPCDVAHHLWQQQSTDGEQGHVAGLAGAIGCHADIFGMTYSELVWQVVDSHHIITARFRVPSASVEQQGRC